MLLETIQKEWDADAKIDETKLDTESLRIPQLHSKYYKLYSEECLRLRRMEGDHKVLRHEKTLFFLDGPTEEQHKKGWQLPAKGKIIRTDVQSYLEADAEINDQGMKLEYQRIKVKSLEAIIDNLNRRSFNIKNAIEFMRWTSGG